VNGEDQAVREILRGLGAVESSIQAQTSTNKELKDAIKELSAKLEDTALVCNDFESFREEYHRHKEERKGIPDDIKRLKTVADDYIATKPLIISLSNRWNRLYVLGLAIQAIGIALLWLIGKGYVRIEI
jgi:predicted nuclease with TOPRIM domain